MLDFEYAKALAEVVLDTTCSKKEREVRLECLTQIFGRANAYLKKGFLPDVVEAFFVRKMEGLPLVSTKQDMQDFLKVSTPHYFGGKFTVSNIPYYSEEEELLLWSETSLRGPLITIRNEVNGMDQSVLSIKNKKFPSALPVLTMISSENVQNVPAWETAHRNQLDLESGNHQLYIVNGGHYIWYTNLTQVVQLIDEWRIENHF